MVFVRKTAVRGPIVYQGDGLFSWVRKAGKTIAKAAKSPVGKVVMRAYKKTLAPIAKRALTTAVGDKIADRIENVGKRTLDGEDIDKAVLGETKGLAMDHVKSVIGGNGVRVRSIQPRTIQPRTSDILRATKPRRNTKPSVVINRIVQEGNGAIEADNVI